MLLRRDDDVYELDDEMQIRAFLASGWLEIESGSQPYQPKTPRYTKKEQSAEEETN